MSNAAYQEDAKELPAEERDMHRAIASLMEEWDAVDVYNQRASLCQNADLKAILEHNRDEEKEHISMLLEWIRRHDASFSGHLREVLFTKKTIAGKPNLVAEPMLEHSNQGGNGTGFSASMSGILV